MKLSQWIEANVDWWVLILAYVVVFGALIANYIRNLRANVEEIACAAIKYPDIGVLALPAPARHHHIGWARLFVDGQPTHPGSSTAGFLTTHGRFVDRVKGLKIATKRGQIIKKQGNEGLLFSEDMWETPPEAWGYTIHHHGDYEG